MDPVGWGFGQHVQEYLLCSTMSEWEDLDGWDPGWLGPGIIHRLLHTHLAGGEGGSLMANDTDDLFI